MARSGIESRSPRLLTNTLTIMSISSKSSFRHVLLNNTNIVYYVFIKFFRMENHHHHHHLVMPPARISLTLSLSPLLPIVHHFWQVLRATSRILAELVYERLSWLPYFSSAMWRSIGVYHLWARPCFSSSVLHVWFILLL